MKYGIYYLSLLGEKTGHNSISCSNLFCEHFVWFVTGSSCSTTSNLTKMVYQLVFSPIIWLINHLEQLGPANYHK